MAQFKNITGTTIHDLTTGSLDRRPWDVCLEADIQGTSIRGAVTAHAANQEDAEKLAIIAFINNLRRAGIWARSSQEEKDEGQITVYHAPDYSHIRVIGVSNNGQYNLVYPEEELSSAARKNRALKESTKPKRRTSGQKALADRKKKQAHLDQKEKRQRKAEIKGQRAQEKQKMLQQVLQHFLGDDLKQIKAAADALEIQYQKVRYSLFYLRDNGFNKNTFDLIEGNVDGKKAFKLRKITDEK